jgi:hypothetical protein
MFSALCTVTADMSNLAQAATVATAADGGKYYRIDFSVILLFGLTEHKALICWNEDVCLPSFTLS